VAMIDPWKVIHAERAALAEDLTGLSPEQWGTPSLCPDWNVLQLLGHLVSSARLTPPAFFSSLASSRFHFHEMTAKNAEAESAGGPEATLAEFRRLGSATTKPPGPVLAMVGENIIHGEDIRRPLGLSRVYPNDALAATADFYRRSNLLIGGKARTAGLTLRATDADWTVGSGPEVAGPMLALTLAVAGRSAGLEGLSGEGLATLSARR
jgi:uncharacterized protein (TIGR03083 family)